MEMKAQVKMCDSSSQIPMVSYSWTTQYPQFPQYNKLPQNQNDSNDKSQSENIQHHVQCKKSLTLTVYQGHLLNLKSQQLQDIFSFSAVLERHSVF